MVMTLLGATCRICVAGTACVIELAMPFITTLIIWTRSPGSTHSMGTPIGKVDGCASVFSCCPIFARGISSIQFGTHSSLTIAVLPCKDLDDHIGAWEAESSNGSSSYQSWAFQPLVLLSEEGGSIRDLGGCAPS